jgi:A/G-specific adenine glycosylase
VPAVDTNVRRVLLRHFAGTVPVPHTSRLAWQLAREVIPPGKAHLLNQAMMDVGAMVCRARAPRCPNCPLRRSCDFRRRR